MANRTIYQVSDDEHFQACRALYRAHLRRGYADCQFNQPARHMTTRRGSTLTLSNCNGKLGRVRVDSLGRMRALEPGEVPEARRRRPAKPKKATAVRTAPEERRTRQVAADLLDSSGGDLDNIAAALNAMPARESHWVAQALGGLRERGAYNRLVVSWPRFWIRWTDTTALRGINGRWQVVPQDWPLMEPLVVPAA